MLRVFLCFVLLCAPFFAGCADPVGFAGNLLMSPVTACTAVYETARDERGLDQMAEDKRLWAIIRAKVQAQAPIEGMSIGIYCYNNIVFITGAVSRESRIIAIDAARKTDGVAKVITHWFMPNSGDTVGDVAIGAVLRAAMISDIALSSTQIESFTCGGNVLLLGVVRSPADAAQAVQVAQSISGVRSVKSYLMYPQSTETLAANW